MGPPGNRGSWGPCVLAQTQKSLLNKGTKGISWGPLLTPPGPWAVPEFPNGQSAPGSSFTLHNSFSHFCCAAFLIRLQLPAPHICEPRLSVDLCLKSFCKSK
ncbi:unnamed protein product [Staurois parvus]|uniref:Uncharacterized protein n=1 Tax=Staurois parvus TaxID=386267 RepID=A0ABN9C0N6_9NEOB|nr:unnamed protein product [Staurois parvus]